MTSDRSNEALVDDELDILPHWCRLPEVAWSNSVSARPVGPCAAGTSPGHQGHRPGGRRAQQQEPGITTGRSAVRGGRAQSIPVADASFDVARCSSRPPRADAAASASIDRGRRVLRPRGYLYVSEPVYVGPLNEVIRLFNDEGVVRAAAQAAVDAALYRYVGAGGRAVLRDAGGLQGLRRLRAAHDRPTFADHRIDDAKLAEVNVAFTPHMKADGAHFTRPMHVRVLRKLA